MKMYIFSFTNFCHQNFPQCPLKPEAVITFAVAPKENLANYPRGGKSERERGAAAAGGDWAAFEP